MPFNPGTRSLLGACIGASLTRLGALLRRLPTVLTLPVAGIPVAAGASFVVASLAATAGPVQQTLELPTVDGRPLWTEEVAVFARRLEEVFGLDGRHAFDFADWIMEASARQQMPPELIAGLIYTESSFRKRARSWAGAIGPAQVKPIFWREFCGGGDLTDPEHNVYCGAQVLAHYMSQCGEFECALQLYNVGPGNMRKPYYQRASHRYLAKVESHRSRMEIGAL
jgi:hypothetical protein